MCQTPPGATALVRGQGARAGEAPPVGREGEVGEEGGSHVQADAGCGLGEVVCGVGQLEVTINGQDLTRSGLTV